MHGVTQCNTNFNVLSFFAHRDRFRTAINVLGDSFVAGAINQTSRKELAKLPPFEDLNGNSSSKNSDLHRRNNEDMEKLPLKSLNADDLHEIL